MIKKVKRKLYELFILVLFVVAAIPAKAMADEPIIGDVTNLVWQEGSTATASWYNATGADYYWVHVDVYYKNQKIYETDTGTGGSSIDLQAQISNARMFMEGSGAVEVNCSVCPVKLGKNGAEDVRGKWSADSSTLNYKIDEVVELIAPKDVKLEVINDRYIATWTHVEHARAYLPVIYLDGVASAAGYDFMEPYEENRPTYCMYSVDDVTGILTADITEVIRRAYVFGGYTGKSVKATFCVTPCVEIHGDVTIEDKLYFANASIPSKESNAVVYVSDEKLLSVADNLLFEYDAKSEKLYASWDDVSGANSYQISYKINENEYTHSGGSTIYPDTFEVIDGRVKVEVYNDVIRSVYKSEYAGDEVDISFCVQALRGMYSDKGYNYGELSEWSNAVSFCKEFSAYKAPTNINVDGDYTISWDNYDAEADSYYILMHYYKGKDVSPALGEYLDVIEDSENSAHADLSLLLRNIYNDYPNPITAYVEIQAMSQGRDDDGCTDSPMVRSPFFIYNPANEITVESINVSPKDMIIAKGRTYALGKTITPTNARYIDTRYEESQSGIVHIDDNGMLTGENPGTVDVTVSVGLASDTAKITVYEVNTNATDQHSATAISESAGKIIDAIANGIDIDLGNTDISADSADALGNKVLEAVENGAAIHTDIVSEAIDAATFDKKLDDIVEVVNIANPQVVGATDVKVEMYYTDDDDSENHHIGNITEFATDVTFSAPVPGEVAKIISENNADPSLVRIHENDDGSIEYEKMQYSINADGTYTAVSNKFSDFVWIIPAAINKPYIIQFDANTGNGTVPSINDCKYDMEYTLPTNTFKKNGYTFVGWNTKKDGRGTAYKKGASVKNLAKSGEGTVILYAQWAANKYSITFDGNGATSGKMTTLLDRKYGKNYTLKANSFKRVGYVFAGWNTKKNGTGINYKNKAKVKNIAIGTNKVVLYAQWKPITYTIKFNANGGNGKIKNLTKVEYGKKYKLTANILKRSGYKFAGWNTKKNGKGKTYKNKAYIVNLTEKNGASVTLYAQWKKIKK